MSVTDAEKFVEMMESDPAFLAAFQEAESWDEAVRIVAEAGLDFTEDEFQAVVLAKAKTHGSEAAGSSSPLPSHW